MGSKIMLTRRSALLGTATMTALLCPGKERSGRYRDGQARYRIAGRAKDG